MMGFTEDRQAARAALDECAEREKTEIEPLQKERDNAERRLRNGLGKLEVDYAAKRDAFNAAVQLVQTRASAAELLLRRSADPLIRDNGPAMSLLLTLRAHVGLHMSIDVDNHDRVSVRDWTRIAVIPKQHQDVFESAKRRVQLYDAAEALRERVGEALEQVRDLQLEAAPPLPRALAEIFSTIPDRCPCGIPIDFADAIAPSGADAVPLLTTA